ncbi:MAG: hypothetical protein M3Z14_00165 [Candidatus Eremiobacteraeota bacterium]|nr:hypothetical protein [Candidatus Eremiobacteraeota bacterium]
MNEESRGAEPDKLLWQEADRACIFLSESPEDPVLNAMEAYCSDINPENSQLARDWGVSFLEEIRERASRIRLGLTGYDPVFAGSEGAAIIIRDMVRKESSKD